MTVTDEINHRFVPLDCVERSPDEMTARAAEFYALMRRRRTVRDFSDRPIPDGVIEHALLTAGSAPSGAHRQPWHFVAVTDPAKKAAIRAAAEKEERAFYGKRASKEWLEALEPLGTDPDKPFLTAAPARSAPARARPWIPVLRTTMPAWSSKEYASETASGRCRGPSRWRAPKAACR